MSAKVVLLSAVALLLAVSVVAKNQDAVMHFIGNRQYEVENPHSVSGSPALHIYYHGGGGWCDHPNEPWQIADAAKAQGVNMLVIAPCGLGHTWDCQQYGPDWSFTQQMIADTKARYNIDTSKVTVSGFSMGGGMTAVLGCEHPDTVLAAVMLNGAYDCNKLKKPVHVLSIEGKSDNSAPASAYNSFARQMGCSPGSGDYREQVCNGKLMQLFSVANGGHMFYEHDPIPFSDSNTIVAFVKRVLGSSAPPVQCASAAERSSLTVGCPAGQVISTVPFASYGTPSGSCAAGFAENPSCASNSSVSAVRSACLGKSTCTVAAENSVFGDPCVTVTKALAVSVQCGNSCGVASEGASLALKCPPNTVIKSVDFASYGTPSGSCDAGGFTVSSCHSATSLSVLQTACLGKNSCAVDASNALFGDPCSGTLKQLAAKVVCA